MARVIVERPRRKPWGSTKGWMKGVPLEDMPGHESMTKKYGWNSKDLNENLAPLYRYLRTNVGRPWDDVNSEICQNIRLTSTVQRHVLQHLWDAVETTTFLGADGKVYYMDRFGEHPADDCYYSTMGRFYVHPITGILYEAKSRKKNYRNKEDATIAWRKVISDTHQLHKISGVWYGLDMARIERPNDPYHSVRDMAYGTILRGQIYANHAGHKMVFVAMAREKYGDQAQAMYCTRKRQLNKKDLKRFGLR